MPDGTSKPVIRRGTLAELASWDPSVIDFMPRHTGAPEKKAPALNLSLQSEDSLKTLSELRTLLKVQQRRSIGSSSLKHTRPISSAFRLWKDHERPITGLPGRDLNLTQKLGPELN